MSNNEKKEPKKFIGIYFECCHVYGRLYPNKESTHYIGRCPKCLRSLQLKIGKDGTSRRFFAAH